MITIRTLATAVLAGALVVGVTPALAACSPLQLVQNAVENAVKDGTGVDVSVGGETLPQDFPAEVATIGGQITTSASLGVGAERVWTVSIVVADLAAGFDDARSKLLAAGFTSSFDAAADGAYTGIFSNAVYTVMVTAVNDGTQNTVTYVVSSVTAQ
jgi:hypothetical protein